MSEAGQRADKWLWCARFYRTRDLASAACTGRKVRLSGRVIDKAHVLVRPGDVLTFSQGAHIRVIRVRTLAQRRGPASEARLLFEDLAPIGAPAGGIRDGSP